MELRHRLDEDRNLGLSKLLRVYEIKGEQREGEPLGDINIHVQVDKRSQPRMMRTSS